MCGANAMMLFAFAAHIHGGRAAANNNVDKLEGPLANKVDQLVDGLSENSLDWRRRARFLQGGTIMDHTTLGKLGNANAATAFARFRVPRVQAPPVQRGSGVGGRSPRRYPVLRASYEEEKRASEKAKCEKMRISELKKELQALLIPTDTFFEKSEFVSALVNARMNGVIRADVSYGVTSTEPPTTTRTVSYRVGGEMPGFLRGVMDNLDGKPKR